MARKITCLDNPKLLMLILTLGGVNKVKYGYSMCIVCLALNTLLSYTKEVDIWCQTVVRCKPHLPN